MVFGGKFRIRRCNSKASYLPRQSLEKLNNSDPDHGSYKLTLTSNEDLVANSKPSYDILTPHNGKISNNLPDVLPLGAKLQPQPASPPSSANSSPLRYGSNNNIATTNILKQQQQQSSSCYPMYPTQHRYSTPTMNSFNSTSNTSHVPSYARSQSFDVNASPTKFMSQSTVDLKKTHHLEPTLEETQTEIISKVLSPAQSENNLSSPTAKSGAGPLKQLSPSTARIEFHRAAETVGKMCHEEYTETAEGRIFRAELVNATLSSTPCGITAHNKSITRKDSLRENIEKITQLQSKLMSAHLSDTGLLGGFGVKSTQNSAATPTTSDECNISLHSITDEDELNEESVSAVQSSIAICLNANDTVPMLPNTPPPPHLPNDNKTTLTEEVVTQITQIDTSIDSLKLLQRSELILRINSTTAEASSQTDDIYDSDIGRLTEHHHAKEDAETRTTLQPRKRHPIELDCDKISQELASLLSPTDKLIEILSPLSVKSATDYVNNLFNPNVPLRPGKRDVGTSTLMRMKARETQELAERITTTVDLQYTEIEVSLTNGSDSDSCDFIKQKVNELMQHLKSLIKILNSQQKTIGEESAINDELGCTLIAKLSDKVRPIEATKFRTYIDDIGHITSLLLSLSQRLARAENSLSTLTEANAEKKTLESKRDRLLEQLEEAKRLKEDIDRRGSSVEGMLEKNLSADEFADFDYFINMKAKLISDAREVADKIKYGEEQMSALSETLTQSDC